MDGRLVAQCCEGDRMMVADEIRALLLIHDRLKAWERPLIRDMAKLLKQRGFLTTRCLVPAFGGAGRA